MGLFLKLTYDPHLDGLLLPGALAPETELQAALYEAKALALRFQMGVEFTWQGHRIWIFPGEDVEARLAFFQRQMAVLSPEDDRRLP